MVPQMVAEVSTALTWTMDHAGQLGGSRSRLSLVGHSAGAHMCMLALMQRALRAQRSQGQEATKQQRSVQQVDRQPPEVQQAVLTKTQGGEAAGSRQEGRGQVGASWSAEEEARAFGDARMPARLVAMAGVYDIGKHYEYEEGGRWETGTVPCNNLTGCSLICM
jgi:hypothetical protein